jgi:hypothetical protein
MTLSIRAGTVHYGNPQNANTRVTFTEPGTYAFLSRTNDTAVIAQTTYIVNVTAASTANTPPSAPTIPTDRFRADLAQGQRISVAYDVAGEEMVLIKLYDQTGRQLKILRDHLEVSGPHSIEWDGSLDSGRIAASGVYLMTIKVGDKTRKQKVLIIR